MVQKMFIIVEETQSQAKKLKQFIPKLGQEIPQSHKEKKQTGKKGLFGVDIPDLEGVLFFRIPKNS